VQIDPAFPIVCMTGAAADDWALEGVPNSILLNRPFAPAQLVTAVSQLFNAGSPTNDRKGYSIRRYRRKPTNGAGLMKSVVRARSEVVAAPSK
jgi:hypothetical protein